MPLNTLQLKFVIERLLRGCSAIPIRPGSSREALRWTSGFVPGRRTTKDVDLSIALVPVEGNADLALAVRERLQVAADQDLGDYLGYRVGEPKRTPNAPKGGARFPCEAVLVGKVYARFHVDVGCGDALVGEPERLVGDDLLSFAGIDPASVLAIPRAQQFAEKLHACTFPWSGRMNTRSKDLVDLVLLIERGPLDAGDVRKALEATFSTRATHPLPTTLNHHPASGGTSSQGWPPRQGFDQSTSKRSRSWSGSGPPSDSAPRQSNGPPDCDPPGGWAVSVRMPVSVCGLARWGSTLLTTATARSRPCISLAIRVFLSSRPHQPVPLQGESPLRQPPSPSPPACRSRWGRRASRAFLPGRSAGRTSRAAGRPAAGTTPCDAGPAGWRSGRSRSTRSAASAGSA